MKSIIVLVVVIYASYYFWSNGYLDKIWDKIKFFFVKDTPVDVEADSVESEFVDDKKEDSTDSK